MKKGYLFISNDSKGSHESELSLEPLKTGSFEAPCIFAANKLGLKLYKGINRIKADSVKSIDYDITYYYQHIYRSIFNIKDIRIGYNNLCDFLKTHTDVDVIHCNTPIGGVLGRLCGKKYNKKVIYTAHGFHFYKGAPLLNRTVFKWIEMALAHYTDALITINKEDYLAAQTFKLKQNGKIYYVPGVGMNLSAFNEVKVDRSEKRASIGIPDDALIGIIVGDLNNNKNVETLIKALAESNSKVHYIICGYGPNEDSLKKLCKESMVENRCHFLGFRNDVKELYMVSDFFLFASKREGLPRSTMEAMACGLPCIVSKIRGNTDLIDEGKGGFLISCEDYKGFAEAINKLVDSIALRKQFGHYNTEKVKSFDLEIVKERMVDIYNEVIFDKVAK